MIGDFNTSGPITENDLKTVVLEHNDKLNHKIKSTLRKIHKLKRENLVLSDRRMSLQSKTGGELYVYDLNILDVFVKRNLSKEDIRLICELSERIGKNGNKIQRLRTKISQLKKSLIPVVDEWFSF